MVGMEYLKIHNWEKFQQYKDDRPLHWIKFHVEILESYKVSFLTDEEFGQLSKIWLLAARLCNKIPNDPKWIKEKASLTKLPNINKLIDLKFLDGDNSVKIRTKSYDDPEPSVPREEKRREEKSKDKENLFDEFWKAYPKKKSKGQAKKAWLKINPTKNRLSQILTSLEKLKKSNDWMKDKGQFIPHPATWLNAEGWEDEVESIKPGKISEQENICSKCKRVIVSGMCDCNTLSNAERAENFKKLGKLSNQIKGV
jgi:hypothetical protein